MACVDRWNKTYSCKEVRMQDMPKMKESIRKIQGSHVGIAGMEQRLRAEFSSQVQAGQMHSQELRAEIASVQNGFVRLRSESSL